MKRVLITGASGFVGYHLIDAAVKQGYEVFAAVRRASKVDHLKSLPISFTFLNFENVTSLEKEIKEKKYNYIIHAAGITKAGNKEKYETVNAVYTFNLASAVKKSGVELQKFVFVSSLSAIGPKTTGIDSELKPTPVTAYGESKLLAEHHLSAFDLPILTIRPTAVYGPRERDIFLMLKAISQGYEVYIGKNPQHLTFIHAADLAEVAIRLLQSPFIHKTYNLTDGFSYDRYALSNIAKEVLEKKTLKVHLPVGVVKIVAGFLEGMSLINGKTPALNRDKLKELTADNWHYEIEEIKRDIGFSPSFNLKEGLRQTLQWYQKNKWI